MQKGIENKYNALHKQNQKGYATEIRAAYLSLIKDVSQMVYTGVLNGTEEFYLQNNPRLKAQVNTLIDKLYTNVYGTAVIGINSEWDVAVEKNNAITQKVYGTDLGKLPTKYKSRYLSNNTEAKHAFVTRKINGLDLSDRVWKYTNQFKQEIELALEYAIGNGVPAHVTAKHMQQYLTEPNKLYRRIRQENGELRLSKAAKAYHPGSGVHRSSYKNALRLVANETNFSYERSNELKREQADHIVGIRIQVSNRHSPIMDKNGVQCALLQGFYPKDFKWTYKWHVNCQCISYTVLKTETEVDEDIRRIFEGKEPKKSNTSVNYVKSKPGAYTDQYNEYLEKVKEKGKLTRTFVSNPV